MGVTILAYVFNYDGVDGGGGHIINAVLTLLGLAYAHSHGGEGALDGGRGLGVLSPAQGSVQNAM